MRTSLLIIAAASVPALVSAQVSGTAGMVASRTESDSVTRVAPSTVTTTSARVFRSSKDSLDYEVARSAAENAREFRVVVSMFDRELYVLDGTDTLLVAPVATAVDTTLTYNGRSWRFETPRGKRRVLAKEAAPVWTPPDWHYAEVAGRHNLQLAHLQRGKSVTLRDGRKLTIRGDRVGTIDSTGSFTALPTDEEIIFDGTVYVPPSGTANRRIEGELGKYKLSMGDGFLLHGTPHTDSIGTAATHGCVRLLDEDIEWLFDQVPVGTPVYIY